jgi:hypothetical protein
MTNDLSNNVEVGPLEQWCVPIVVPHQLEPIMGSGPKDRKVPKEIDDVSTFINLQVSINLIISIVPVSGCLISPLHGGSCHRTHPADTPSPPPSSIDVKLREPRM